MMFSKGPGQRLPGPKDMTVVVWEPGKARRLRELAIKAYRAAETPTEAKMASILLTLFAPDVERAAHGLDSRFNDQLCQSADPSSLNDSLFNGERLESAFDGMGGSFGGGGSSGSW